MHFLENLAERLVAHYAEMAESVSVADWTRIYSLASTLDGDGNAAASAGADAASAAAAAEFAGAKEWASLMTGCSHDHAAERRVFEMPRSAQLACCAVYRRTGNLYFSEGSYDRALERYQRALTYYEYAFADDAGQQLALHRVRLSCLLNSASCHLRLRRPEDAISMLTQALSLLDEAEDDVCQAQERSCKSSGDATVGATARALAAEQAFCRRSRVKALLRRAVAHFHQQDFDAARGECDAAETALRAFRAGSMISGPAETSAASAAGVILQGELSCCTGAGSIAAGSSAFADDEPAAEAAAAHAPGVPGSSLLSLDADDIDADAGDAGGNAGAAAVTDAQPSAACAPPAAGTASAAVAATASGDGEHPLALFCRSAAREIAVIRAAIAEAVAEHEAELRFVAAAMFKSR